MNANSKTIPLNLLDLEAFIHSNINLSPPFSDNNLYTYLKRSELLRIATCGEIKRLILEYADNPIDAEKLPGGFRLSEPSLDKNKDQYKFSRYRNRKSEQQPTLCFEDIANQLFGNAAEVKFLEIKESLDEVIYSMARNRDYRIMREIYFQCLDDPDSFGKNAHRFSGGPERHSRGIVGPIAVNKAHPEILKRLKTAEPKAITRPFLVEGWWICIRVEYLDECKYSEEVQRSLSAQMLNDWIQKVGTSVIDVNEQKQVMQ